MPEIRIKDYKAGTAVIIQNASCPELYCVRKDAQSAAGHGSFHVVRRSSESRKIDEL
jgi:hypothetical protein